VRRENTNDRKEILSRKRGEKREVKEIERVPIGVGGRMAASCGVRICYKNQIKFAFHLSQIQKEEKSQKEK
jgi:hypothetical protein